MISESSIPLAEVEAFGIFHHGHATESGIFSRHDVAKPIGVTWDFPFETGRWYGLSKAEPEWLVDFGMPVVTTPQADIDAGYSRWNKLILRDIDKKIYTADSNGYTVTVGTVGKSSWLYRATDGSVFKLTGYNNNSDSVFVQCSRGAIGSGGDVVASVLVGGFLTEYSAAAKCLATFAPNGQHAALNWYIEYTPYTDPLYRVANDIWVQAVVEVVVSGGSQSTLPTVTLSVTYADADSMVLSSEYHEVSDGMTVAGDGAAGIIADGCPSNSPFGTHEPLWNGSSKEFSFVRLVDYDESGTRYLLTEYHFGVTGKWRFDSLSEYTELKITLNGKGSVEKLAGWIYAQDGITRYQKWGTGWYPLDGGFANVHGAALLYGRSLICQMFYGVSAASKILIMKASSLGAINFSTDGASFVDCGNPQPDGAYDYVTFNPEGGGYSDGVWAYF